MPTGIHTKLNCQCCACKSKRGEYSGKNNPMYDRKQKQSSKAKMSKNNSGKKHPKWRGEKYQKDGRWMIWINNKRVRQSRYIAEQCLKRKLTTTEEVHHINGDCLDDRPENLYVFATKGKHTKHHRLKFTPILISNIQTVKHY